MKLTRKDKIATTLVILFTIGSLTVFANANKTWETVLQSKIEILIEEQGEIQKRVAPLKEKLIQEQKDLEEINKSSRQKEAMINLLEADIKKGQAMHDINTASIEAYDDSLALYEGLE